MKEIAKVFISYATEDSELAHQLAQDLKHAHIEVWIAPDSIPPGQDWVTAINQGLQQSQALILLLTPAAVRSRWVNHEMSTAMLLEEEKRLDILPVMAQFCPESDIPPMWRAYQRIDAPTYEALLEHLLQILRAEIVITTPDLDLVMRNELREALVTPSNDTTKGELLQRYLPDRLQTILSEWAQDLTRPPLMRGEAFRWLIDIGPVQQEVLARLVTDPSSDFLREFINAIISQKNCHAILSEEQARQLLSNPNLPRTTSGVAKAIRTCIRCGAPYTTAVFLAASKHPIWEVKLDCITRIIAVDDQDSLKTLESFATMSYWIARQNIANYIHKLLEQQRLNNDSRALAFKIIDRMLSDGKTSSGTPLYRHILELEHLLQQ